MTAPHRILKGHYRDVSGKERFLRSLFDRGARYYDRIGAVAFLGTGGAYRRRALRQAGLVSGMHVLDVACGTGAVTREIHGIVGQGGHVIGVDPSPGMLAAARQTLAGSEFHVGHAESLPAPDASADFLCMGYALRHVGELEGAFREFGRVLKPNGRVLLLEISCPQSMWGRWLALAYFGWAVPALAYAVTWNRDAYRMMTYYWETIDQCVPPSDILTALERTGFDNVERRVELGIFSAYQGTWRGQPSKSK